MANKSQKQLSTSQRKKWLITLQQSAANKSPGAPRLISVVLDSNVWISAVLFGGKNEAVVRFCLAKVEIVASENIVEEVFDFFKTKTKAPQKWRRYFRITFERICTIVPTTDQEMDVVRDPKDNHVIAAALASNSRFIVTGDKDLQVLSRYQKIKILSPAEFLKLMASVR